MKGQTWQFLFLLLIGMAIHFPRIAVASQGDTTSAEYDFSYSYQDPTSVEAGTYIVDVSNAVLWNEGSVRYWKQDVGSSTLESGTPGVITYRFSFQQAVAEAELLISTATFHWSYSKGNAYIYGSQDGTNWVQLSEGLSPDFGAGAGQVVRTLPDTLLGGNSLWFKVELYSYGSGISGGGPWTNTAQHSRHDVNSDNTTFQLNVNFSGGGVESTRQQCATYDVSSNIVGINCVAVDGVLYSAELGLYTWAPLQFRLNWIGTYAGGLPGGDCAEYDSLEQSLYIPCLRMGEDGFAAGLVLTSIDPIIFSVQDVVDTGSLAGAVINNFDVSEDAGDPLIATFADIGGKHYAVYGPKDSEGIPQYYELVETFRLDGGGSLQEYLTIEFDSSARPILFRLPAGRGEVAVQYVSTYTALVTITASGVQETVEVTNPYPDVQTASVPRRATTKAGPRFAAESEISFSGDIKSCAPEATPTVTIKRTFDSVLRAKYPLLAQGFSPKLSSGTSDGDEGFFYWYKITIPGEDYDAWYWKCAQGFWLDPVVGFFGDKASRLVNFFRDLTSTAVNNTTKGLAEEAATAATGGLYPVAAFAQNAKNAWETEGAGMKGSCSETAYDFKRRRLMHRQEVTVEDDGSTIRQTFQPVVRWDGVAFSYDAPDFDFTGQCQECDSIALARIIDPVECSAAGGYWWPSSNLCECPWN